MDKRRALLGGEFHGLYSDGLNDGDELLPFPVIIHVTSLCRRSQHHNRTSRSCGYPRLGLPIA
jgi:hypothetical protein